MSIDNEIYERVKRIETKLIRGFEEMGINTDVDPDWLSVDDAARVIYLSTTGRSLTVINSQALRKGARQIGKQYMLVHKGEEVGSLFLQE